MMFCFDYWTGSNIFPMEHRWQKTCNMSYKSQEKVGCSSTLTSQIQYLTFGYAIKNIIQIDSIVPNLSKVYEATA